MPGPTNKKRRMDGKAQRPTKKQRKIQAYNSDSESEDGQDQAFDAVNLLDSDDDIHNAMVDDAGDADEHDSSSSDEEERPAKKMVKAKKTKSKKPEVDSEQEAQEEEQQEHDDEESQSDLDDDGDDDDDMDLDVADNKKSKRNDPTAFATSLSKILSTKLSTSKRSDPVLARSAAAHEASKAAVDSALEAKARRKLKEQKRMALEKGRVKDVLAPPQNLSSTGEPEVSTAEVLQTERKLRKIAQRGVVRLFNAVRAAQVKATEAEKSARKDGVIGMKSREEKVNELSKKGFLELIASGGGGLKKGPLEEA